MNVTIVDHPLLDAVLFVTVFPRPLGELETTPRIHASLQAGSSTRTQSTDEVRKQVRDLLRYTGYKPTGRGKPSSEYLLGVAAQRQLPSINLAVDACNLVSLDFGLPISVVDLDRVREPLSIRVAPQAASYVFNASGQTIDLGGLLCLFDGEGPCANAVKDAQRTKTHAGTTRTLSVIWSSRTLNGHGAFFLNKLLLEEAGARIEKVG